MKPLLQLALAAGLLAATTALAPTGITTTTPAPSTVTVPDEPTVRASTGRPCLSTTAGTDRTCR